MTYAEKLKDPRWQKKRLEIMQRDGFKCRHCQDGKSSLNVHHLCYGRGKLPHEYPDEFLITLCESCHKRIEQIKKFVGILCVTPGFVSAIIDFLKSRHGSDVCVIPVKRDDAKIIPMEEAKKRFQELRELIK